MANKVDVAQKKLIDMLLSAEKQTVGAQEEPAQEEEPAEEFSAEE